MSLIIVILICALRFFLFNNSKYEVTIQDEKGNTIEKIKVDKNSKYYFFYDQDYSVAKEFIGDPMEKCMKELQSRVVKKTRINISPLLCFLPLWVKLISTV